MLQLAVHDYTVCYNEDVVVNDFIVRVMQRGQAVGQPCNGVCLPASGTVFNEVVQRGFVFPHICQYTADNV